MSFFKKIGKEFNKFFKKADEVNDKLEEVQEKVEEVQNKIEEVQDKVEEVKDVVKATSVIINGHEIHDHILERYIELFIEALLIKYTVEGKALNMFAKGFTKVLNPVFKKIARKIKNKLVECVDSNNMKQSAYKDKDLDKVLELAEKALLSRKISAHIRRSILLHIAKKLTPDWVENKIYEYACNKLI